MRPIFSKEFIRVFKTHFCAFLVEKMGKRKASLNFACAWVSKSISRVLDVGCSAYGMNLDHDHENAYEINHGKNYGFSVRCLQDSN